MARVRDRLKNVDPKIVDVSQKRMDERVADILNKAIKQCDDIISEAEKEANEILSVYKGRLLIKNEVNYNILENNK